MSDDASAPTNVIVYHIGSLGDTLMALPALWALRAAWPQARFVLLTKTTRFRHVVVADAVLEGTGLFAEVIEYPGTRYGGGSPSQRLRQAWLFVRLRIRSVDAVVYLAPSERDAARVARDERFFQLAGIARRIGFRGFSWDLSRAMRPLPVVVSEAGALLDRLRLDGLAVPALADARRDCAVGPPEIAALDRWLQTQTGADRGRRWLALAPGSNMASKIWPLERYVAVAKMLVDEFDLWPVAFGGPEDVATCAALCDAIGRGYVAAGALSLRAAAAAMRRCALYLGNDTGTMHLAASEEVACVVPFSARDFPGKWHPVGTRHAVIRRRPDCEGCMLEDCVQQRMRCMRDIDVDEVTTAARTILREDARTSTPPGGRAVSLAA